MPGEESLKSQRYYGNPRNQFWGIISIILNKGNSFSSYSEKTMTLLKNGIGLWDVLNTCFREGSCDSSIRNTSVNDFNNLFIEYPNVEVLIFNGKDSYKYYSSHYKNKFKKEVFILSSTSSANTHETLSEKVEIWENVLIKYATQ